MAPERDFSALRSRPAGSRGILLRRGLFAACAFLLRTFRATAAVCFEAGLFVLRFAAAAFFAGRRLGFVEAFFAEPFFFVAMQAV